MPTPQVYEAANEYQTECAVEIVNGPGQRAKDFLDPIREFENTMAEVEGTLRNWNTLDLNTRIAAVRALGTEKPRTNGAGKHSVESEDEQEIRLRRIWRSLNFIIQEESRAEKGSREVALMALNLLFPAKPAPVAQKALPEKAA